MPPCHDPSNVSSLNTLKGRMEVKSKPGDFQHVREANAYHPSRPSWPPYSGHGPDDSPFSAVLPEYPYIQFVGENPLRTVVHPDGSMHVTSFREEMRDIFRELDSIRPGRDLLRYTNRVALVRREENARRAQRGEEPLPPLDCLITLGRGQQAGGAACSFAPPTYWGVGGIVAMDPSIPVNLGSDVPGELYARRAVILGHEIIHHNEYVHGWRGYERKVAGVEPGYYINENTLRSYFGDRPRVDYYGDENPPAPYVTMHNALAEDFQY